MRFAHSVLHLPRTCDRDGSFALNAPWKRSLISENGISICLGFQERNSARQTSLNRDYVAQITHVKYISMIPSTYILISFVFLCFQVSSKPSKRYPRKITAAAWIVSVWSCKALMDRYNRHRRIIIHRITEVAQYRVLLIPLWIKPSFLAFTAAKCMSLEFSI